MLRAFGACEQPVRSGAHGLRSHRLRSLLSSRKFCRIRVGYKALRCFMASAYHLQPLPPLNPPSRAIPSTINSGLKLFHKAQIASSVAPFMLFTKTVSLRNLATYAVWLFGESFRTMRKIFFIEGNELSKRGARAVSPGNSNR